MAAKAFSDPTARLRLIALDRVSNDPLESDVPLQTTFPASLPLFDLASETPLPEIVNFPTGQAAGAINDIPKAADVFQQMINETEGALAR